MGFSYLQPIPSQRLAFDQSATLLNMEDYGMDVDMEVDLDPIDNSHNLQQVVSQRFLSYVRNLINSTGT